MWNGPRHSPGANIVLVEANSASDTDLFAAVDYAHHLAGVSVISMSWGSDDIAADASFDQGLSSRYLATPTGHQGITFVASSGDNGVASFPSTSPNVLSVGGTDLYLNSNGTIASETAWTPQVSGGTTWSGGGGVSQEFAGRKAPDVSYNAGIGMAVYDSYASGGWTGVGGTSAGAPQWAALIAVADQGRAAAGLGTLDSATQTRAALFAAASADFHDITQGSTQFQSTGAGYDLATGLGSPVANRLIPYLASHGGAGGGTTTTTVPAAPATLTATANSSSQVTINWSPSTGATGYTVYELENGQAVSIGTFGASLLSDTISNLNASTTYSFQVAAFNSAGSAATNWALVTTKAAPVVTAPTGVSASTPNSTTINISWNAVANATGYKVFEVAGGKTTQVATVTSGTSASITGLTAGSTVSFYVTAYNATSTANSATVSVTLPSAATGTLSAPTNVTATATSSTTGTVAWTGSTGATGYEVYYWNGFRSVLLGTFNSSTTSVTIQGMSAGSTYYFYVAAYNNTKVAASDWVALTTSATAAFAAANSGDSHSSTTGSTAGHAATDAIFGDADPWWLLRRF